MIAILLCAGFGTRLYPLTKTQPKALLPVAGKPVIDYLVDQLLSFRGLSAVHLVTNHRHLARFEQWAREAMPRFSQKGIFFQLHDDGARSNEERLGANGDLAFVLQQIESPQGALIAAGDNILRFGLQSIWDRFYTQQENIVLAIREDDPVRLRRTGVLELDSNDRVTGLYEKPEHPPSHWSCPPFYFLSSQALADLNPFLTQSDPPDAMGYLLAYLVDVAPITAIKVAGDRLDIGDLESYWRANELLSP